MGSVVARRLRGAELPSALTTLPAPPEELWLSGPWPDGPAVALVGTRKASAEALRFTSQLARELAERGIWIVSGGAEGIDTAAHRGALAAQGGGATLVVAPAGIERPYPAENAELFQAILGRGGAYVSLVPPAVAATRQAFFPRNAVLVALAQVLVVVETGVRGGARNAAKVARALGRPCLVVPQAPWCRAALGGLVELELGARPLVGLHSVLEALSRAAPYVPRAVRPRAVPAQEPLPGLGGDGPTERVLRAVQRGRRSVDEVCEATQLSAAEVSSALLDLALESRLRVSPSGRIELVNT